MEDKKVLEDEKDAFNGGNVVRNNPSFFDENVSVKSRHYVGYKTRVFFFALLSIFFIMLGTLLLLNILSPNEQKVISYQEKGNIDYRVTLKKNDFYEEEYLDKGMVYVASLIDSIDLNVDYSFIINEESNINLDYEVIGKLSIYDDTGMNVIFSKEYVLLEGKKLTASDSKEQKIAEVISLDYDYYNSLANNFKATYGVESESNLTLYVKIKKDVTNINLNEKNQMLLTVPLTQKTINITMNDQGINSTKSLIEANEMTGEKVVYLVLFGVVCVLGLIVLIKLVKLLLLLIPSKSKYDAYLSKLLTEYDRLIVETPTVPNFEDKKIIKIKSFDELLDVRDNLKKPIIFHELVKHHKSYFYIEQHPDCYLLVLKANDIDANNEK